MLEPGIATPIETISNKKQADKTRRHLLMMKFITTENEEGKEEIFLFPKNIDHDAMAEVLGRIKNHTHGNWRRVLRTPISAGFVSCDGKCHGNSETLGLQARPEDTILLVSQGLVLETSATEKCAAMPNATSISKKSR